LKYLVHFCLSSTCNINGEIEGVAVITVITPQALANINLKESLNVSGPYLIMCLYFIIEPNEEASISYWNKTGWITQGKVLKTLW
jgi:hypothetical protein